MPQGLGACALNRVSSKTIADIAENVSPAVCGSSFSLRNSSRSGGSDRNGESADRSGTRQSAEVDTRSAPHATSFPQTPPVAHAFHTLAQTSNFVLGPIRRFNRSDRSDCLLTFA